MRNQYLPLVIIFVLYSVNSFCQTLPELIYYKFDSGDTITNYASSPVGTNPATLAGTNLTVGGSGMFGTALVGIGASSSDNYISTGWGTSLTSSFTIGFWSSENATSSSLWYAFGDNTASSFRCFTNGVAGANNWLLRCTGCGMPDISAIEGASESSNYIHFVYDDNAEKMRAYVNGIKVDSADVISPINISGTDLKVGSYGTNSTINGLLDEFRLYNRALTEEEILATYNVELIDCQASVGLEILNEDCESVSISWDSVDTPISTYIEYGNPGFSIGQGVKVHANTNPFSVTGLNTNTTYEFYVVDSCSSGSTVYSNSIIASTLLEPIAGFNSFLIEVNDNGAQAFFDASTSEEATSYFWLFGDGSTGEGQEVVHYYTKDSTYQVRLLVENECGSDVLIKDFVVDVVSTNFLETDLINIYPIPFTDKLNIQGFSNEEEITIEIYNIDGKLIYESKNLFNVNNNLDLSHILAGNYILRIQMNNQVFHKKILKSDF